MNGTAELEIMPQPTKAANTQARNDVSKTKPGPKPKKAEETVRYFLAKEGSSADKPELGEEIASEGEALIRAFRSKDSLFFTVTAYRAEAETKGGNPTIVKRPARK
jgi:hypothetical protein